MQHCEECGAELPENALFCGRCGRKAAKKDEIAANENISSTEDISETPSNMELALNHLHDIGSDNEEQQQIPDTSSENDTAAEEKPLSTQNPIVQQETQSSYASAQKSESRHVFRRLLFSFVALILILGIVVVEMGMFHPNLPGFGGSSQASSSSSYKEVLNLTGSSLTASICAKTSTPSSSTSNQNSTFIFGSSSGCSTATSSKTDSSCLIFPNPTGSSHQFIVDVSNVSIDSQPYHLVLSVTDYTGSATYTDAKHITVGLSEGASSRNFSWFYRSGNIAVNNDEQSGTMDVMLGEASGQNTLHIIGNWTCGHQMKAS